jgi:hypothetical protein
MDNKLRKDALQQVQNQLVAFALVWMVLTATILIQNWDLWTSIRSQLW